MLKILDGRRLPLALTVVACIGVCVCCGIPVLTLQRMVELVVHPGANRYSTLGVLNDDFEHVYTLSEVDLLTTHSGDMPKAHRPRRIVIGTRGPTRVSLYVEQSTGEFVKIERVIETEYPKHGRIDYELRNGRLAGSWHGVVSTAGSDYEVEDSFSVMLSAKVRVK
jgi:hypothetical protein